MLQRPGDPAHRFHHDQALHAQAAGEGHDAFAVAHRNPFALPDVVGAEHQGPAAGDMPGHPLIAGRQLSTGAVAAAEDHQRQRPLRGRLRVVEQRRCLHAGPGTRTQKLDPAAVKVRLTHRVGGNCRYPFLADAQAPLHFTDDRRAIVRPGGGSLRQMEHGLGETAIVAIEQVVHGLRRL